MLCLARESKWLKVLRNCCFPFILIHSSEECFDCSYFAFMVEIELSPDVDYETSTFRDARKKKCSAESPNCFHHSSQMTFKCPFKFDDELPVGFVPFHSFFVCFPINRRRVKDQLRTTPCELCIFSGRKRNCFSLICNFVGLISGCARGNRTVFVELWNCIDDLWTCIDCEIQRKEIKEKYRKNSYGIFECVTDVKLQHMNHGVSLRCRI